MQNLHLRDIWNLLNNDVENVRNNIWITLADKTIDSVFDDMPVFKGLCEVMNNAVERKLKNKGKQNMQYPKEFTSFLVILGGLNTKVIDLFHQNLKGRSIQSIR